MTTFVMDDLYPLKPGNQAVLDKLKCMALRPWLLASAFNITDAGKFTFLLNSTRTFSGSGRLNSPGFQLTPTAQIWGGAGGITNSISLPVQFASVLGAGAGSVDVDATIPA